MAPDAGWDMPLEYSGMADEHMAVRTRAGLFDVSHMGKIEIAGKDALPALQRITSNDLSRLKAGDVQYSGLLTRGGTFVDDLLLYRLGPEHFLLILNAGRIANDYTWIADQIKDDGDVVAVDVSSRYAALAVQGPAAAEAIQPLTGVDLQGLRKFSFAHGEVANVRATVSRTGYTGEDGFEILVPPQSADRVWQAILASGGPLGLVPAGVGARETLRLEAGLRQYGNDIDETTTPLEAGLGWIVGWDKTAFNGEATLREQKERGVSRTLVGFELLDQAAAGQGQAVYAGDTRIGIVTSGAHAPALGKAIGMAYIQTDRAVPGAEVDIEIDSRRRRARIVPMPFYKRGEE